MEIKAVAKLNTINTDDTLHSLLYITTDDTLHSWLYTNTDDSLHSWIYTNTDDTLHSLYIQTQMIQYIHGCIQNRYLKFHGSF